MLFHSCPFVRFSASDDQATLKQEANLCVMSCLQILQAIYSHCKFNLLCDCLRSIEMWMSALHKKTEQEENQMTKDMTRVVVDSFEVVKKWLKKNVVLTRTIPCYIIVETDKELEVNIFFKVMP